MPNVPISGFTVPANTVGIGLTGYSLTGSSALSMIDLAGTWNTSGTPTALKLNVTDTASNASSLLLDLQVGGSSRFVVSKGTSNASSPLLTVGGNGTDLRFGSGTSGNGRGLWITGSVAQISVGAANYGDPDGSVLISTGLYLRNSYDIAWASGTNPGSTRDLFLTRRGAANLRLGAADAAAPVAQTLSVQSVVAGTSNTAGANLTITGSQGTGTGAGGSIVFQVAPAGGAGSVVNGFSTYNALSLTPTTGGATNCSISRALITSYGRSTATGVQNMCSIGAGTDSGFLTVGAPGGIPTVSVSTGGCLAFSSNANNNWNDADVCLFRDAANTLALRNSTNAQTFNVYGTFTDASNYERLAIKVSTTAIQFISERAGSGSNRYMQFTTSGGAYLDVVTGAGLNFRSSTGTGFWQMSASGHFLAGTDNTYDIGASGATRPRDVYVGTSVFTGTGGINFDVNSRIRSPADGQITLFNAALNDFGRLNFGGTTSSFPALKRSSTVLQSRLADDSDFAPLQGQLRTHNAYTAGAPTATGYIVLYDSTGTAYKVPAEAL